MHFGKWPSSETFRTLKSQLSEKKSENVTAKKIFHMWRQGLL